MFNNIVISLKKILNFNKNTYYSYKSIINVWTNSNTFNIFVHKHKVFNYCGFYPYTYYLNMQITIDFIFTWLLSIVKVIGSFANSLCILMFY